jgi:hypothetical protein
MPNPPVKAANLALRFALELAALAAFAYWGTTLHGTAVSALAAVAVPLAMIVLWGTFAAPHAQHRLSRAIRIPFELAVFALAAGALLAAGARVPAAGVAALVLLNSVVLTRFDQWDH